MLLDVDSVTFEVDSVLLDVNVDIEVDSVLLDFNVDVDVVLVEEELLVVTF